MPTVKSTLQSVVALLGIAALMWAIWVSGRDGLSSRFAKEALDNGVLATADKAIAFNPRNPEAYYARASLYRKDGRLPEAINDLEHAVKLRSGDQFLRVELGYTRYQAGDLKGATADFAAAVRLAPFYAQPRWYLGNMLLQAGSLNEGFAELRLAVKSDPTYLPETIQRAAEAYDGDSSAIVRAVGTESPDTRLTLERYFIEHNNLPATMELFRANKDMPAADARALLTDLLTAKRFSDASEVWLAMKGIARPQSEETTALSDGGFENEIDPDAFGFEWQLERRQERIGATRDPQEFHSGAHSLRVDYNGNSNPSTQVVSQLVLVKPNTDYLLSFAAQTRDLVTGGLPLITVTDVTNEKLLAQSSTLPEKSSSWQNYAVDCKTAPDTQAVIIAIQRANCSSSPCPAFGHAWFDDFVWRGR